MDQKIDDKQEIVESLKQIRRSSIILIVLVVAIAILFFGLAYYNLRSVEQPSAPTLEELYQKTLAGEESENNFMYNGYVFVNDGFLWHVRTSRLLPTEQQLEYDIPFYYNPKQVENVTYEPGARNAVLGKQIVYLTQDPNNRGEVAIAAIEVGRIIGTKYGLLSYQTKATVTRDPPEGQIAITCQNVSSSIGVVYFKVGNQTAVYEENGCLIVEGTTPQETIRAADRLSFVMLNIMPDPQGLEPEDMPLATAQMDGLHVEVQQLRLARSLQMPLGNGYVGQDTAQGVFYVPLIKFTNTADQNLTFSPGVIKLQVDNRTYAVDYKRQRFLDAKLDIENKIAPGKTKTFQMAYDVVGLYSNVTLIIDFVGKEPLYIPVTVPRR